MERVFYILGTTGISNIPSEKEKSSKNMGNQQMQDGFMKVVPIDAVKVK